MNINEKKPYSFHSKILCNFHRMLLRTYHSRSYDKYYHNLYYNPPRN